MPGNFKKEDLRIVKTYRSLFNSIQTLLNRRNFTHITVNDLCEEAQLSRTAFYTHFRDKYDLLASWLRHIRMQVKCNETYDDLECLVNTFVATHKKSVQNLIENANNEVLDTIQEFIISLIGVPSKNAKETISPQRFRVMCNFVAGGVVDAVVWQMNNGFPPNQPLFNPDFYNAIMLLKSMEGAEN